MVLGAALGACRAAETGRIDEADRAVRCLDDRVDGVPVVPGMSWTTERSSPSSLLKSVDLPTLGRPMMATAASRPSRPGRRRCRLLLLLGRERWRQELDHGVQQVAGAPAVQRADRERIAHAEGDELPRRRLAVGVVDLVDHQPDRWPGAPDDLGRGQVLVGHPGGHVDDQEHDVGLGQRRSACSLTLAVSASPPANQPPVSMMENGTPVHSAVNTLRSRVTPGSSSTHGCPAHRRCGSPTTTTCPRWAARRPPPSAVRRAVPCPRRRTGTRARRSCGAGRSERRAVERGAQRVAVAGHDFDGAGRSASVRRSRKRPSLRQASGNR